MKKQIKKLQNDKVKLEKKQIVIKKYWIKVKIIDCQNTEMNEFRQSQNESDIAWKICNKNLK